MRFQQQSATRDECHYISETDGLGLVRISMRCGVRLRLPERSLGNSIDDLLTTTQPSKRPGLCWGVSALSGHVRSAFSHILREFAASKKTFEIDSEMLPDRD